MPVAIEFGQLSLVGEIVDSKCFTGAMNPGRYKQHRACAAICLAGGIPPIFVVSAPRGSTTTFLLVGPGGEMLNEELLPHIARTVRIDGQVRRYRNPWVMRIDPDTIKPL